MIPQSSERGDECCYQHGAQARAALRRQGVQAIPNLTVQLGAGVDYGTNDRWKNRQRIRLADLLQRPIVLRESGSGSRWCLQQALLHKGHDLDELNVTLELGSNEAVKEAVLNNTGIAVLSRFAVQRELDDGRLISLKIQDFDLVRKLSIVSDTRRALPRSAQTFLQFWLASHSTAIA